MTMKLEPGLQPLATAVAALVEQADHARSGGDWHAASALLGNAGYLCEMIGQRQKEAPKRGRKPKEKPA